MILYFSGTGNSKYVANAIGDGIKDEAVSLNDIIKNDGPTAFNSEKPFIVVAPIHAWRFPRIIEEFIKKAKFSGNREIYFVGTMASQSGNCDKYCKEITERKHMKFKGFIGVFMPNNYVISSVMPTKEQIDKILQYAKVIVKDVVQAIENGENLSKIDKTAMAGILSGPVNKLFNKFMVSSKNFVVSDKCISCGKCEEFCAVNNIKLVGGKPAFGDNCINCYSCIHRCPKEAINIKGKTENHGRYVCSEYEPVEKTNIFSK